MDVLLAMGYGGSEGRGMVTQASNDGGIDGVIDQDALRLSKIYVQAKRYGEKNSVCRPEVQSFVGAMHGQATQGALLPLALLLPVHGSMLKILAAVCL